MGKIIRKSFKDRNNYVYVMETSDKTVKVGRSKNPDLRRKQLQTGNPNPITIQTVIRTEFSSELERQFKNANKEKVVNGEHYNMSTKAAIAKLSELNSQINNDKRNIPDTPYGATPFCDTAYQRK